MAVHKLLIAGAGGRMGRAVMRAALATPGVTLAGGFERPDGEHLGWDLGLLAGLDRLGLVVAAAPDQLLPTATALVDFTTPAASLANARAAAAVGAPLVIGTTGFSASEEGEIAALSAQVPIVKSGNMSLGVNLLAALVRLAASRLGPAYDIEIVEAHHRAKVDAPSGTALMLGEAAAAGRGVDLGDATAPPRIGATGPRTEGAIGFAVIRGGGVTGDHDVSFAGAEEVITLSHRALDRALFARGAVAAACWVAGRPPGLYSMADVLELN